MLLAHIHAVMPGTRVDIDSQPCGHAESTHMFWLDVVTIRGQA
jgi:sRNA-binding protein